MSTRTLFKWRHFLPEVILLNVRWYCRYALSYRDLEEMMQERGIDVDHSTLNRWVLKYAPELDKRIRPHLQPTNDSWRVDETYIQVKGEWKYLYRAVDSMGNTLDFMRSCEAGWQSSSPVFPQSAQGRAHASSPCGHSGQECRLSGGNGSPQG